MASDDAPRYPRAWFALGWLMVLAVSVGSLAPSGASMPAGVSDKFLHFAAYAGLAFVFMGAAGRHRWLRIAVGLLALGASIELAQAGLTEARSAEWLDMAANALGVAAGIAVAWLLPGNWCRQVEAVAGVGRQGR
jgi:hypothetical protein